MPESSVAGGSSGYKGRLEVVEGPTGRRRWPDAVKARIVQESFAPGVSVSAVARRHGMSPQQLTGWRRAARDGLLRLDGDQQHTAEEMPAFVSLAIADASMPMTSTGDGAATQVVEIVAGDVTVRLPGDAEATRIAAVAAELAVRR